MKFDHTAHKEMWTWLSENPKKEKKDWPGWDWNEGIIDTKVNLCFACDYGYTACSSCPLLWPKVKGEGRVCHSGGLYEKWVTGENAETRTRLALQIANLPVKEGVETE